MERTKIEMDIYSVVQCDSVGAVLKGGGRMAVRGLSDTPALSLSGMDMVESGGDLLSPAETADHSACHAPISFCQQRNLYQRPRAARQRKQSKPHSPAHIIPFIPSFKQPPANCQ